MALITLNLRDLRSGQRMLAEFETLDSCLEWLEQRPQFVDVLGPVDESLSMEGERMLRNALRPYDAEENALIEAAREKRDREIQEQLQAELAQADRRRTELATEVGGRGPNDAMQLVWKRGGTLVHNQPLDQRPIPALVALAVEDWVKERDSWVHARGQRVSEAVLSVWPGEIPKGDERVQSGGQFEVEFIEGA